MKWYWYVAKNDELLLDVDNIAHVLPHLRQRLQGAIECGKLDVDFVYRQKSQNKTGNHEHIIIKLKRPMRNLERYVWEIILRGDLYRGCSNIMRHLYDVPAPSVFISPHNCFFFRHPDHYCECKKKHKLDVMTDCPVAKKLRGEFRDKGFFGKPSKANCEWI
jgi:hypothetical protein